MTFDSPFERQILDLVATTPAPGKHCARNAVRHLEKASIIADVDPAMALLRGITAEEEAATAVFHSVKRRQYVGARRLNPRNHLHKNALIPFCAAVAELFAEAEKLLDLKPQLLIRANDPDRRLELQLHGAKIGLGDRGFSPIPPLHFSVVTSKTQTGVSGPLHDFGEQLQNIATVAGTAGIRAHLEHRANVRNQVLYASSEGIPDVTLGNFLKVQQKNVKTLLVLYLLIDPYRQHQFFVSQCLLAFLKMLGQLPPDLSNLDTAGLASAQVI